MWLRGLLDKAEYRTDDTTTQAVIKGLAVGVLEGLVILGAIDIVSTIIDEIKK